MILLVEVTELGVLELVTGAHVLVVKGVDELDFTDSSTAISKGSGCLFVEYYCSTEADFKGEVHRYIRWVVFSFCIIDLVKVVFQACDS